MSKINCDPFGTPTLKIFQKFKKDVQKNKRSLKIFTKFKKKFKKINDYHYTLLDIVRRYILVTMFKVCV